VVIRETKKLLETSPNRERLKRAWADFDVYGELRLFRSALATELREAKAAAADGRPLDAAEILEEAAKREVPDAFRTRLLAEAGWQRREGRRPGRGAEDARGGPPPRRLAPRPGTPI
jgi:hypothetical protein